MPLNLNSHVWKRSGRKSACSLCRKKKVKCDGNAPCSTCLKYKNQSCDLLTNKHSPNRKLKCLKPIKPNLVLEESRIVPGTILKPLNESEITTEGSEIDQEIKPLYYHSKIPYDLPQETISVFEDGTKVVGSNSYSRKYFGPLSWFTLLCLDDYTLPYVRYIEAHKKNFKTINEDFNIYTKEGHSFQNTNAQAKVESASLRKGNGAKLKTYRLGVSNCELNNVDLVERIKDILPQRKITWNLIDCFFSKIYPYFPLVDEFDFKKQVEEIIGEQSYTDERLIELTIKNNVDFSVIGILLIFLRLTYLALTSNLDDNKLGEKSLASNIIGIDAFRVADRCFNQFNYIQCNDIQVLQLALYIRVYYTYAPEEGDGLDNRLSRTLNSAIIQMAHSLGFSRDPDHLCYKFNNARLNNLSRKIWYFVRHLDNDNSILFGDPLSTSIIPSDTKIPYYSQGNENCINKKLEKGIIQSFASIKTRLELLETVFNLVLNVKGINITRLLGSLTCLESYLQERDIIWKTQSNFTDAAKLESMIELKGMLDLRFLMSSIYFKIFIHYEKKKNDGFVCFYAKKLLELSVIDALPYYLIVLEDAAKVFDEFSLFYIMPSLIRLSQKLIFCLSFILIRIKYFEFKRIIEENNNSNTLKRDSHYLKVQTLSSLIQKCMHWVMGCLKRLGMRYYIAWRLYKVHSHTLSVMLSENFYSESKPSILSLRDSFNENTVDEMIEILKPLFNETGSLQKQSSLQRFSDKELEYTLLSAGNDITTTDFDGFWLDMLSMKHDSADSNYEHWLDIFDPYLNTGLELDPGFDLSSVLAD